MDNAASLFTIYVLRQRTSFGLRWCKFDEFEVVEEFEECACPTVLCGPGVLSLRGRGCRSVDVMENIDLFAYILVTVCANTCQKLHTRGVRGAAGGLGRGTYFKMCCIAGGNTTAGDVEATCG